MDESGIMTESDERSRFYILTLVCHDQSVSIEAAEKALVHDLATFGIVNLCFHAGPVIHANDQFEFLSWDLRRRIFTRMMGFVRRIKFGYRCIVIDKKYANTKEQIVSRLYDELTSFFDAQRVKLSKFDQVKVYYDCGQKATLQAQHPQMPQAQANLTHPPSLIPHPFLSHPSSLPSPAHRQRFCCAVKAQTLRSATVWGGWFGHMIYRINRIEGARANGEGSEDDHLRNEGGFLLFTGAGC